MKWLCEIPKPLLKRLVMVAIVFPPIVALTNIGTSEKPAAKVQDTLKIYRKTANVVKPSVIQTTTGSFFDSRCTGFQAPGF